MPAKILTLHSMTFEFPVTDSPEQATDKAIKAFTKACKLRNLAVVNRPYAMAQGNLFNPTMIDIVVRGAVQPIPTKVPINEKENASKKVENL